MFLYFRDLRIHFFLSSLIGGLIVALIAYVIMSLLFVPRPVCVLIGLAYFFLWTIFRRTMAEKKASERFIAAMNLRIQDCRIQDYIHFYEILLAQNKDSRHQRRILLNMSSGYLDLGDDSKAKEILDELTPYFVMRQTTTNKIIYFNNMTTYYLHMRDLTHAKEALAMYQKALDDPALKKSQRVSHLPQYADKAAWISLLEGHGKEVESFYLAELEANRNQLSNVHAHDMLTIIYRQINRPDLALASKVYLTKYGGDTIAASRARLELNNAGT